jgi:hypothetical protein
MAVQIPHVVLRSPSFCCWLALRQARIDIKKKVMAVDPQPTTSKHTEMSRFCGPNARDAIGGSSQLKYYPYLLALSNKKIAGAGASPPLRPPLERTLQEWQRTMDGRKIPIPETKKRRRKQLRKHNGLANCICIRHQLQHLGGVRDWSHCAVLAAP